MVKDIEAVSEYATTVIRLFPDYAESVIWFPAPVAYEETRLDAPLITELQAWEASYYVGLTPNQSWRSPELETRFHTDGVRLARLLADQLGDHFQVEYDHGDVHHRIRGAGLAQNPDAAGAFQRLADAARDQWALLQQIVENAAEDETPLEWRSD